MGRLVIVSIVMFVALLSVLAAYSMVVSDERYYAYGVVSAPKKPVTVKINKIIYINASKNENKIITLDNIIIIISKTNKLVPITFKIWIANIDMILSCLRNLYIQLYTSDNVLLGVLSLRNPVTEIVITPDMFRNNMVNISANIVYSAYASCSIPVLLGVTSGQAGTVNVTTAVPLNQTIVISNVTVTLTETVTSTTTSTVTSSTTSTGSTTTTGQECINNTSSNIIMLIFKRHRYIVKIPIDRFNYTLCNDIITGYGRIRIYIPTLCSCGTCEAVSLHAIKIDSNIIDDDNIKIILKDKYNSTYILGDDNDNVTIDVKKLHCERRCMKSYIVIDGYIKFRDEIDELKKLHKGFIKLDLEYLCTPLYCTVP